MSSYDYLIDTTLSADYQKTSGNDSTYVFGQNDALNGNDIYYIDRVSYLYKGQKLTNTITEGPLNGDNDTVSTYVDDYILDTNIENLILRKYSDPVYAINGAGLDIQIFGHPAIYNLDYQQGDEYNKKVLGNNYLFQSTCGATATANLLKFTGRQNITEEYIEDYAVKKGYLERDPNIWVPIYKRMNYTHDKIEEILGGVDCYYLKKILVEHSVPAKIYYWDYSPILHGYTHDWDLDLGGIRSRMTLDKIGEKVKAGYGVIINLDAYTLWGQTSKSNNNAGHTVLITGVSYFKNTDIIEAFYVCDSGSKRDDLLKK